MKYKEKNTTFSQNLIRLRKERGLSQRKLAELAGLSQRIITYYENEIPKSPIDNIQAIAKALDIDINSLFDSYKISSPENELTKLDSRTINKIKTILSLPKNDRHIIYFIAEAMLAKRQEAVS